MSLSTIRVAATLTSTTVLGSAATLAHADLGNGHWNGPDDFAVQVTHMPDFDQVRATLPGIIPGLPNDGSMYCVPTSVMNLSAFVAAHGHPDTFTGNENWQSAATYDTATAKLATLGIIGGTHPSNGTYLSGMHMQALVSVPLDRFTVGTYSLYGGNIPKVTDFAQWTVQGSLVAMCHGWYQQTGSIGGIPVLDRNGGHCVTFTGASAGIFDSTLRVRDPADDSTSAFTQSTFTTRSYDWEQSVYWIGSYPLPATRIQPAGGDGSTFRIIDAYTKITPKMGVSLTPSSVSAILTIAPGTFATPPQEITFPDLSSEITAITFGPDYDRLYAITDGAGGQSILHCSPTLIPEWTPFDDLPIQSNVNQIMFGADRTLYLLGGGELTQLLLEVGVDQVPDVIASEDVSTEAVMAFDNALNRVVLIDPDEVCLKMYPADLGAEPIAYAIPDVTIEPGASMAWDETRGAAWVTVPGDDQILKITPVVGTNEATVDFFAVETGFEPDAVEVDDLGHLLISDGERWHEYMQNAFGSWEQNEASFFNLMPVGPMAEISRSRTNFTPGVHDTEAWRNVVPESFGTGIVDCLADLDGDRVVGFGDLVNLLAGWGPCPTDAYCSADFDFDGAVGFGDVVRLLAEWGACPE